MAFFDAIFPERISREAEGGPRFLTSKAYASGGQRITNRDATYPKHEYSIAHPPRAQADFEALRAFFYVVGGDADAFRFKDWSDFRGRVDNTTATPVAGVANTWQLCRTYTFGSRQFIRPIYKLAEGCQVIRVRDGVETVLTAAPDVSTGRVVITEHAVGDVYRWSGEFHVPVAFKDPAAVWRVLGGHKLITEWSGIELEEVRL